MIDKVGCKIELGAKICIYDRCQKIQLRKKECKYLLKHIKQKCKINQKGENEKKSIQTELLKKNR